MNEIVFPAAILQYPFFDAGRDAAANYGGIGAVIGHEIGHGFDDQGSRYDGDGTLRDWWTDADRAAFEERTKALIAQYDELVPEGLAASTTSTARSRSARTSAIWAVSGIALKAYELSLAGAEAAGRSTASRACSGPAALLGAGLAAEGPRRRDAATAHDRPALAERVPLQPDRPQHRRVLRGVRCDREGRAVARRRRPGDDLVTWASRPASCAPTARQVNNTPCRWAVAPSRCSGPPFPHSSEGSPRGHPA